jgi:hypothetical protein
MTTLWPRPATSAGAALIAVLAIAPTADAAWVSQNLLRGLLARAPIAADRQPTLDATQLESCIRTARELDRSATSLDNQMIVIQDTTSRVAFSHRLDGPQLPKPGYTEKEMRAEFDQRMAELAAMQQTLDRDSDAYRRQLTAYNSGLANFEHDCAGTFRKQDLDAVKARLKME